MVENNLHKIICVLCGKYSWVIIFSFPLSRCTIYPAVVLHTKLIDINGTIVHYEELEYLNSVIPIIYGRIVITSILQSLYFVHLIDWRFHEVFEITQV